MEAAVQNVERRVLARLRNHRFFSLSEAREAIAPLLAALNERPFQKTEGSRRSLFEDLDRPALKPLPARPLSANTKALGEPPEDGPPECSLLLVTTIPIKLQR